MLADDHVLMREGIRQLLEFDGTISVVAEANNGVECMEQLLSVHPDILLLDINMPVMNGIEVLQEIKKKTVPYGEKSRILLRLSNFFLYWCGRCSSCFRGADRFQSHLCRPTKHEFVCRIVLVRYHAVENRIFDGTL